MSISPTPSDPPDRSAHVNPTTYLSAAIPGTGGLIKQRPEDFIVEEVPLYDPSGQGEHIYLFAQKIGISTAQLVEIVAKHFRVPVGAVGYAGLKDKHAITRQVISVHAPGKRPEDFPMLRHERVQVLWVDQHENKLRRGHLKANRFAIKVREAPIAGVIHAKRTLELLADQGVPNRLGEQRFGFLENNHLVGRAIVLGDDQLALNELLGPRPEMNQKDQQRLAREAYARGDLAEAARLFGVATKVEASVVRALMRGATPSQAIKAMGELQYSFVLSALQSAVFNALLDERLSAGTIGSLALGDVAAKHDSHGVFAITQSELDSGALPARLAQLEISPTGPMWSHRMMRASGAIDAMEVEALARFGLTPSDFERFEQRTGHELRGERRALRVRLEYPEVEAGSDEFGLYIKCSFELPPGSFATVVMREVMKPTGASTQEDEE
jgi:tRNA pseudouridine13 synthase